MPTRLCCPGTNDRLSVIPFYKKGSMKTPHFGGRRVFVSAVLILGGTSALVAGRSAGKPTDSTSSSRSARFVPTCAEFLGPNGDMDNDRNNAGIGPETVSRILALKRNKKYMTLKLEDGAFVGALENTHRTKPSITFPQLKPGEKGCIWFQRYKPTAGEPQYDGVFYHEDGRKPTQLTWVLYCKHDGAGNPDRKPIWAPIPDDGKCEEYRMSVGRVSVMVPRISGQAFTPLNLFPLLQAKLIEKGLSKAAARAAVAKAAASGPWYPCEANGCCRAT